MYGTIQVGRRTLPSPAVSWQSAACSYSMDMEPGVERMIGLMIGLLGRREMGAADLAGRLGSRRPLFHARRTRWYVSGIGSSRRVR